MKRLIVVISVILILIDGIMNDFTKYLGRGYICYEEHQSDVHIYHNEKPHFGIPSNITDYKNTIDWILIRQIPSEENIQKMLMDLSFPILWEKTLYIIGLLTRKNIKRMVHFYMMIIAIKQVN